MFRKVDLSVALVASGVLGWFILLELPKGVAMGTLAVALVIALIMLLKLFLNNREQNGLIYILLNHIGDIQPEVTIITEYSVGAVLFFIIRDSDRMYLCNDYPGKPLCYSHTKRFAVKFTDQDKAVKYLTQLGYTDWKYA